MSTTTVSRLRPVLADYFEAPRVDTAIRRARTAGQIPAGTAGRDGCGSASITIKQSLLIVLALASDRHPMDAVADAERIAGFKLLRRDRTHTSETPKRTPFENQHITLMDALTSEVERYDPPDRVPSSWSIASMGACQDSPDRLVFGPSLEALEDPAALYCVVRSCTLPSRLLADIAELVHGRA